jgi:hypothetical protein
LLLVVHHGMTNTKVCLCALDEFREVPHASADSAYIFAGGLNNELTEGDVITIFSQYVASSVCPVHEN